MKKVIDGKVYNTDTALLVGQWDNGLPSGGFEYCDEALYLSPGKQFFLWGEGGPMTRWSRSNGKETWGISDIVLLSPYKALYWEGEHLDRDIVLKFFKVING